MTHFGISSGSSRLPSIYQSYLFMYNKKSQTQNIDRMNPLEENDSHSHLFRLPALNPLRSSLDWTLFMSLFELPGLMVMFFPFYSIRLLGFKRQT